MADQPAKVALGLSSLSPADTLTLLANVVGSMEADPQFPNPPVKLSELGKDGQAYSDEETSISREEVKLKARRTANKERLAALKKQLGQLGTYVDGVAQGSRAIIEAAGMTASAAPTPVGKLPRITGLTLVPGGAKGQVQVKWDAVSRRNGGMGYMVHAGSSPDKMTSKEFASTASYLLTGLPSGQEAWVCVQALGKDPGDCCQPQAQMVP